jgi:hypothetical protein
MENENSELRGRIHYYQDLLDVCTTPVITTLRDDIVQVVAYTKSKIGEKLLVPKLDRQTMDKIIDDSLEARGVIQGLSTVVEMLNPESIKIHIENLQKELEQKPDEE